MLNIAIFKSLSLCSASSHVDPYNWLCSSPFALDILFEAPNVGSWYCLENEKPESICFVVSPFYRVLVSWGGRQ